MNESAFINQLLALSNPDIEREQTGEYLPSILPISARFLRQLVQIKQPKNILEIGSACGHSAILMLKNCQGNIFCVEKSELMIQALQKNINKEGLSNRFTLFAGDADEIVPLIFGSFDFIFLDSSKSKYDKYLPYLIDLLPKGGLLVADNVLFKGRMVDTSLQIKKSITITRNLDSFLQNLFSDNRLLTSLLPIGDGMTVSIKQ